MTDGEIATKAVDAALAKNWELAINLNVEILATDKGNIDALNRLGYAYMQVGSSQQAKQCFSKVLSLDKYNNIADKNLKKLSTFRKNQALNGTQTQVSPLTFLEEPGKTKIINCLNTAPEKVLSQVANGQEVYLKVKKHGVEIRDSEDVYLAVLPDDIAFKLIRYISGGNQYTAHIKSIAKNTLTVFLRELARGKKFISQPSFTPSLGFISGSHVESATLDKPDVGSTGEDSGETSEES